MNAHGGRWMNKLLCLTVLGGIAAGCSSSDTADRSTSAPTDSTVPGSPAAPDPANTGPFGGGSVGGGSVGGGLSSSFVSGGGLSVSVNPATGSTPGLTVRGVASGTAPANQASVVVLPSLAPTLDGSGAASVSPQDRKAVLDTLAAQRVAAKDVSFDPDPRTDQARVQVNVPVDQLAARGPGIVQAVEKTLGRARSSGATFSLADCEPASAPLRRQAVDQAQLQARALADAGHLALGGVVAITQESGLPVPTAACPTLIAGDLDSFDAPAQVKLSVAVRVTYAISGAPASPQAPRPLLWAAGTSTAKAKADQAYVVVIFGSQDPSPTGGPSAADRAKLYDALGKLKVDRKDVQVVTSSDYGVTTVVQVETKAAGLDKAGKDIVRAVEDVLGRSDTNGARFASSTCDAILATARKNAVADGRQRAGNLATAAGVKLAELQSLADASPTGVDPCDGSVESLASFGDYSSVSLQPFDAEPEFSLTAVTELGFAMTA